MAGTLRTKDELDTLIAGAVYPNSAREINATELQALLLDFNATYYPDPGSSNPTYPGYDPLFPYQPGANVYVIHNGSIWRFISSSEKTGVEPGTDTSVWVRIPASGLAHVQNTDIKIGVYNKTYTSLITVLDIDLRTLSAYNGIRLNKRTGADTITVILANSDIYEVGGQQLLPNLGLFRIYVDDYDNNTYLFSGGDFVAKNTITGTQSLTKGQFMTVFTYISFDSEGVEHVYIREEATGKLSDAGATNPFDQSLNTTDSPTLQALTLAQQSGDEGRVFVTGALGQVTTRAGFKVNPASDPTNPNTLVILEHIYSPSWVGAEGAGDKALIVGENGKTKKEDLTPFSSIVLTSFKMIDNLGDTYTVSIVAGTLTLTKDE